MKKPAGLENAAAAGQEVTASKQKHREAVTGFKMSIFFSVVFYKIAFAGK